MISDDVGIAAVADSSQHDRVSSGAQVEHKADSPKAGMPKSEKLGTGRRPPLTLEQIGLADTFARLKGTIHRYQHPNGELNVEAITPLARSISLFQNPYTGHVSLEALLNMEYLKDGLDVSGFNYTRQARRAL